MVSVTVSISPAEFRKMIADTPLSEMYDSLTKSMIEMGVDETEAHSFVSSQLFNAVKSLLKAKETKSVD